MAADGSAGNDCKTGERGSLSDSVLFHSKPVPRLGLGVTTSSSPKGWVSNAAGMRIMRGRGNRSCCMDVPLLLLLELEAVDWIAASGASRGGEASPLSAHGGMSCTWLYTPPSAQLTLERELTVSSAVVNERLDPCEPEMRDTTEALVWLLAEERRRGGAGGAT